MLNDLEAALTQANKRADALGELADDNATERDMQAARADVAERERAEVVATYVVTRLWLERAKGVIVALKGYTSIDDKERRIEQVLGSIDDALAPTAGQALLAQMAAMRAALEVVSECSTIDYDAGEYGCARCFAVHPNHEGWCEVGAALAPDAGATTLAIVKAATAWGRADAQKAHDVYTQLSDDEQEIADDNLYCAEVALRAALATPQEAKHE